MPKLISLQLHSLSLNEANDVTDYYRAVSIYPRGNENKIDAIYIEEINHIAGFNSMSLLCPNMKYFKIKHINMNVESFLRTVLKNIGNNQLCFIRSLCFNIPSANDEMIVNLQQMIEYEQLLFKFTIKRVIDGIYLKWI